MRSKLRQWWPEMLVGSGLVAVACAPAKGCLFLAAYTAVIAAGGWMLRHRHGTMTLHDKVDRMTDGVGAMLDEIRSGKDTADDRGRPRLSLVRKQGE